MCMGYLWDADKTDVLIDPEGWVHSGDLGRTDKEGFFYVTGRIKVGLTRRKPKTVFFVS